MTTIGDSRSEAEHRLESSIEELRLTGAVIIEIRGAYGLGKTRLLRRAVNSARAKGLTVAAIDGLVGEIPLLAVDQLTRLLGGGAGAVSELERIHHLRDAIELADAASEGVMLAFDDAHLLGPQDRAALEDLVKVPPARRLLVVLTSNTDSKAVLVDRAERPDMRRFQFELGPLDRPGLAEMISEWLGPGATTSRFLVELLELTNGNPRWCAELMRHLETLPETERDDYLSGAATFERLRPPLGLIEGLMPSVIAGDPAALSTLRGLAVIGSPGSASELAAVTGTSLDETERALSRLEDASVVVLRPRSDQRGFWFRVPLLRLLIEQGTPTLLRRRLHSGAARLSEERSTNHLEDLTIAHHYVEGEVELTPERIERLIAVARELIARSRYAEARALLEAAVRRGTDPPAAALPAATFVLLAEALSRTGAIDQARTALVQGHGAPSVDRLIRAVRDDVALGQEAHAGRMLEVALDRGDLSARDQLRVSVEQVRILHLRGESAEALRRAEEAISLGERLDEPQLAAEAAISSHINHLQAGRPRSALASSRRAMTLARRTGVGAMAARTFSGVGNALSDAAGPDRGARWLKRARLRAEAEEDFATIAWTSMSLATALTEGGQWIEAERYAADAVRIDASLHRTRALRRSRSVQSRLSALRGQSDGLDRSLEETFRDDRYFGGPTVAIPDLVARLEHRMLAADLLGAADLAEEMISWLNGAPESARLLVFDVLPAAAEVAQARGDEEQARRVVAELARLNGDLGSELPAVEAHLALATARLAMARGDWRTAIPSARVAAARFAAVDLRWRAAVAEAVAGTALARSGRREEAAETLRHSYQALRQMGATPRLREVRETLNQIGKRPPRAASDHDGLTPRQWEVARLASLGRTDLEIADALGISHRTVTTHMHQVLGRAELKSRRDLAEWIARGGRTAVPGR